MVATINRNIGYEHHVEAEILTIEEVARFLRVPKSTVYKLARAGRLSGQKIGKHWRFMREDVRSLMRRRKPVEPRLLRKTKRDMGYEERSY